MRNQAAKILASLVLITGLNSLTLQAQLTVRSVGSVRHDADTQVTILFSAPVEQTSATTFGNYTFSVTGASLMTGLPPANAIDVSQNPAPNGRAFDNECVVLTVTGLTPDATASVTIQNVQDRATPPNTIAATTINFKDSGYAWAESGTPAIPGKVIAVGTNGFDIFSAGSGQWANYDEVLMVYKPVTGDFDFKARVEFQDFSSQWARAGVMARESLNEGESGATQRGNWCATPPVPGTVSRYVDVHPNPVQCFNSGALTPVLTPGNNAWESHIRNGTYIPNNGGFQVTDSANMTPGAPPYPNAWVRIQRVGDDFHTFHSGDGINWDPAADRLADSFVNPATVVIDNSVSPCTGSGGDPLPMKPTLFLGPAFGPETVNIMPPEGKNRLFLYQVRFNALDVPYLRVVDPNASGVVLLVEDGATGVSVNTSSVRLTFDGNSVTAAASKAGTTTTIAYKAASPFVAGSNHSVTLTFTNTLGNAQSFQRNITIPAYQTIPASYAVASASNPGFNVRAHQIDATRGPDDENSLANAEEQAADGYIDSSTGQPYPNTADLTGATGGIFAYNSVINWNNNGAAYGALNLPADIGNWQDINNPPYNIADVQFPGMPGNAANNHNAAADAQYDSFVEEVTAYVQLKAGAYRMGVNSDDGFKVSVAPGAPDVFGQQLGVWNTGRGSSDSFFDFVVVADGIYPFRLLWWNGAGGANLEWFTVDLGTGEKILLNETGNANAVVAYRTAQGRAYVKSILPANGYLGASLTPQVKIQLEDGLTQVANGSVSLRIDGSTVTPTTSKSGTTTTVAWSPPSALGFGSTHTVDLVWTESTSPTPTVRTNTSTFTIGGLASLPAGTLWIEAEDFDSTGQDAQARTTASTWPYAGGAYDGLGAIHDVDYHASDTGPFDNFPNTTTPNPDAPSAHNYRIGIPAELNGPNRYVPMDSQLDAGTLDVQRPGGFDATTNFKIGWDAGGEWYNYTRANIPAGLYTAVGAYSHGDAGADVGGTLSLVTAGVGTSNQTLVVLGSFTGPAPGGWGNNAMVPFKSATGDSAVFKLPAGPKTLRETNRNGDYDWFAVVPVTGVPPKVTAASPPNNPTARRDPPYAVKRDAQLSFTLEDFSTAVVLGSVKLMFDGADVTSAATINKNVDITTVNYDPPGLMDIGSAHSYSLIFSDNGTPSITQTNSGTFLVHVYPTVGTFVIEAEDFDSGGGQHQTRADTMPYLGGDYAGLGAIHDVDYHANDVGPFGADCGNPDTNAPCSWLYRTAIPAQRGGPSRYVPMDSQLDSGTLDVDRGTWTATNNFKVGWTAQGEWYNYTRTIPANSYQVWAALSHGDLGADLLTGGLDLVTAGVGSSNQTVQALGTFKAPGTGGWGNDGLVPLKDSSGNAAVVSLGGVQTLRFDTASGDYDYFLLVPVAPPLRFNAPTISGNNVNISWTGTGTLQEAANLTGSPGDWGNVAGSPASPFTVPIGSAAHKFYRLIQ